MFKLFPSLISYPPTFITTSLPNNTLTNQLEKQRTLLISEFLTITQQGPFGYHQNTTTQGTTDSYLRWPEAIIALCKKYALSSVVEFGCGDGALGVGITIAASKQKRKLSWTGIDIDQKALIRAKQRFDYYNLFDKHTMITDTFPSKITKPTLCIFSYSLDSLAPEVFLNTNDYPAYPDAITGVEVSQGILREKILSEKDLERKNISYKSGIFQKKGDIPFNLTKWILKPGQRAYLSIDAFTTLHTYIQKLPIGSLVLILEELHESPVTLFSQDMNTPKDVQKREPFRSFLNRRKLYTKSASNFLYYPNVTHTYEALLTSFGVDIIAQGNEQAVANSFAKSYTNRLGGTGILGVKKHTSNKLTQLVY